jgi:hypothetical protein
MLHLLLDLFQIGGEVAAHWPHLHDPVILAGVAVIAICEFCRLICHRQRKDGDDHLRE